MPFNDSFNGFKNEIEFIKSLNNKRFKNLNYNLQLFIEDIFENVNNTDKINCYKNKENQKCDIFIKINNVIKKISIKKGVKNSVHTEPISEFVNFLIENHIPRNIIINFLRYHYADGTTNGSGKNRISVLEYKETYQKEIDEINKFLNDDILLKKAIDRFILRGRNSNDSIDVILYGVPNDFI